jgi:hypothetical protein
MPGKKKKDPPKITPEDIENNTETWKKAQEYWNKNRWPLTQPYVYPKWKKDNDM